MRIFKDCTVVKAVDGRFLCVAQLLHESGVLRLIHGTVDVVGRALVVAAGEKGAVHVHALERDDGRDGIIKMQVELRAQALDLLGHGITRERTGRNNDLTLGDGGRLRALNGDVRVRADALRDLAGKGLTIHGERAAGGDTVMIRAGEHDGIEPPQLLLEQTDGIGELIAAQRVGAHELRKIRRDVRRSHFFRLHFDQPHRDAPDGELISRFGTGKTGSDNRYSVHLSSFGVSFFSVLSAADSCGFSAVLSAAALRR